MNAGEKPLFSGSGVGESVRLFRTARGLGQADLGRLSQVPASTISRIETGGLGVAKSTLDSIARVLDCSTGRLAGSDDELLATRPWMRAYADAPKKVVDEYVADSQIAVKASKMAGLKALPDVLPIYEGDLDDSDGIEEHALLVREAAGLDSDEVIPNVIRAAERLGCLVLPMQSELGRHLGLSTRVAGRAVVRVSRATDGQVPGDRQRFTVAHELGHLSLHYDVPSPTTPVEGARVEKQAHRFASSFLIPADALARDLSGVGDRVTLSVLVDLKRKWGYSVKGFVGRIRDLGIIDDTHARSLYKQISARKWNRKEPITVGGETAKWLEQALDYASPRSPDPVAEAALRAQIGSAYFQEWLDWASVQHPSEVIDLGKWASAGGRVPVPEPVV